MDIDLVIPDVEKFQQNICKRSFVLPTISGIVVFSSTLAMSTLLQLQMMHVSTGTRPLLVPWSLGVASVAVASLASQYCAIQTYNIIVNKNKSKSSNFSVSNLLLSSLPSSNDLNLFPLNSSHSIRVCAAGIICFKLLGGRFWAIAPSSYTNLGSFARVSIPANSSGYASSAQRRTIERMGRITGCHTCGSRMPHSFGLKSKSTSVNFIADHMPPNAVVKQMNERWFRRMIGRTVKQRFYPQCVKCSNKQGGILSSAVNKMNNYGFMKSATTSLINAGGGKLAHNHGLRLRTSHLAGGLIAGITIYNTPSSAVKNGSQQRFRTIFSSIEHAFVNFNPLQ